MQVVREQKPREKEAKEAELRDLAPRSRTHDLQCTIGSVPYPPAEVVREQQLRDKEAKEAELRDLAIPS